MATPTSSIQIANLALHRLGQPPITNLDNPTTAIEDACALNYDTARRELLRSFIFNFSKRYKVLTASDSFTPEFGYATAYALPNDFIRLLAIGNVTLNADTPPFLYDVSEGHICTDMGDDDGLNIHYIFDAVAVHKYDPLFISLLKLRLARAMAYRFTLKSTFVKALDEEYEMEAVRAAAIAGQEKPPRRVERSRFRNVRRFGTHGVDPTRYPW